MNEDVNHDDEGHRLYAEQGARELAYFELGDDDHDLVERIVYGNRWEDCWQCITVELLKLMRDPLDPETLAEEAEAIKYHMVGRAFQRVKEERDRERQQGD